MQRTVELWAFEYSLAPWTAEIGGSFAAFSYWQIFCLEMECEVNGKLMVAFYFYCDAGEGTCDCGWLQAWPAEWKSASELRESYHKYYATVHWNCHLCWVLCCYTLSGMLFCCFIVTWLCSRFYIVAAWFYVLLDIVGNLDICRWFGHNCGCIRLRNLLVVGEITVADHVLKSRSCLSMV